MAVCYGLSTLAVHLGMLDSLDIAVRGVYGPVEVRGPVETRAELVVKGLQPTHLAVPLLLVVAVVSLLRRSLRPFAVLVVVGGLVIFVTLGTKWVMARTEANSMPVGHGSSPPGIWSASSLSSALLCCSFDLARDGAGSFQPSRVV
jgi:hypothetical protein